MSYLGKTYTMEKTENLEKFLTSMGTPQEIVDGAMSRKASETLVKNGDTYTLTTSDKKISFQSGVAFDETLGEKPCKSTYVVDGDTITHTQRFTENFAITFKKKYSGNKLVVEGTHDLWDGVAYAYYSA